MTAGSYCYIGPQGIVHGTVVRTPFPYSRYRLWEKGIIESCLTHMINAILTTESGKLFKKKLSLQHIQYVTKSLKSN